MIQKIQLAADEVHIWLAHSSQIPDSVLRDRQLALLSPDERETQGRFHFEHDRELYLMAHALVRCTLSRYADLEPSAWSFVTNKQGRPEIAPSLCSLPLRFNLSHTRGLAACAVTLARDVGVDVEFPERFTQMQGIADGFFSPSEVRALQALPEAEQRELFFSYWTLKESYIKARGLGLSIPLEQFSFDLSDPMEIRIFFDPRLVDDPRGWQFALFNPTTEHRMAFGARCRAGERLRALVRSTVPLES